MKTFPLRLFHAPFAHTGHTLTPKGGEVVGMVLTALMAAITQTGGHSVAIVAAMAAVRGPEIIGTIIVAYFILGCAVAGLCAWIGVTAGRELMPAVTMLYGRQGKVLLAVLILAVSLPASAVTGFYLSGMIIHSLTGIFQPRAGFICLVIFTFLAAVISQEGLKVSNTLTLLLAPAIVLLGLGYSTGTPLPKVDSLGVNWIAVFALTAFHSCGIRILLAVETGAALKKKGCRGIILAAISKAFEGFIALVAAYGALIALAGAELVLSSVSSASENTFFLLLSLFLMTAFTNVMVPAMTVSGRQITILCGFAGPVGVIAACIVIAAISLAGADFLILFLSLAGTVSLFFIIHTAWTLHRWALHTRILHKGGQKNS